MARPRVDINKEELRRLARLNCTLDEVAAFFECSRKTIENRMNEDPEIREIIERGRDLGKLSVRRKQFELMNDGSVTMAIWLGKQLLGQSDKHHINHDTERSDIVDAICDFFETATFSPSRPQDR